MNQLVPVFLSYLPVSEDEVEAQVTYDNLTIFIEQHSSVVLGNNFQNLPQLLNILGTAINTNMVTENVRFCAPSDPRQHVLVDMIVSC